MHLLSLLSITIQFMHHLLFWLVILIIIFKKQIFQISHLYSGLVSFRMDWLNLLAVQGTLKSLLLHHSSEASILQCSAFFIVFVMWLVSPLSSVHFPHMLVSKPDLSILPHGSVYPGQSVQDLITVTWCHVLISERDQTHLFPLSLQSCLG